MKRLAWLTTIVLATLAVVLLAWQFRQGVWLFLLSLAVAAAFRPPINNLARRGVPLGVALILVYSFGFAVIATLILCVWLFKQFDVLKEVAGSIGTASEALKQAAQQIAASQSGTKIIP